MPAEPATPRRGRRHDPRVDRALIDAAIEELNESGYAAFTTAAVAQRAGASTASLYRRWPSKDALAGAVARHIALEQLGNVDTGSLEGDLRELLTLKQRILNSTVGPALLSLIGQAAHSPDLRRILHDEVYLVTRCRLETLIEAAVERREIPASLARTEIDLLALVLIGTGLARSTFLPDPTLPASTDRPGHGTSAGLLETGLRMLIETIRARHPEQPPE